MTAVLCDEDGKVALCATCGQLHSPYWSAAKSKYLHAQGQPSHKVRVLHASEVR